MSSDQIQFTANGVAYSLVVTFAGTATSGTVQSITGTVGGSSVTGLVNYDSSDQVVNAASPYFSQGGVSFVAGGVNYNLAYVTNYPDSSGKTYTGYLIETGTTGNYIDYDFSAITLTPNVCYVEGTHILTERGEVAVEHLRIGDIVISATGAPRPIKWLGHRRVDCRKHPRAHEAFPVRIGAHAFGPDKPQRDLYVSPGHALCVDVLGEVLVPAYSLINGTTIQQIEIDSVVYWHVELESHDILLAENLPAESYLDMGNRNFFVESGVVLIDMSPDAGRDDSAFCRPMHTGGPLIEALRQRLQVRAQKLGWTLATAPFNDLHLMVDGVRVDPQTQGLRARFAVAAGATDVFLVCTTSQPWNLPEARPDARPLGVCLTGLSLDDGAGPRPLALDDARLGEGFHALETHDWGAFRWTNGRARLARSLLDEAPDGCVLEVAMLMPPLPFWVAPAAPPEAAAA